MPKPRLYSECLDILLLPLLEQIHGVGQSTSVADQDALRDRIATAESFLRETTMSPVLVCLMFDLIETGEADAESERP